MKEITDYCHSCVLYHKVSYYNTSAVAKILAHCETCDKYWIEYEH